MIERRRQHSWLVCGVSVLGIALGASGCSSSAPPGEHVGRTSEAWTKDWTAPPCGAVLSTWDNTSAYSNGACTGCPNGNCCSCAGQGTYGLQYQCVELVMRYFQTKWGLSWYGNAAQLLANAPGATVDVYYNGDAAHPPVAGDMIVWNDTTDGHVALVTSASSSAIGIMQQNVWGAGGTATLPASGGTVHGPAGWNWADPAGWAHAKANTSDKAPQGTLDAADCNQVAGWSYDPDTPSQAINVDLYFGGPAGSGSPSLREVANVNRPDLCTAIGSCPHGFTLSTPIGVMDNAPHQVFAYGIDSSGNGDNPLLSGAPKTLTCPPPKIPYSPAIKRHVPSPTVLSAWKFNLLTDLAHLADADLNPVPQGADTPAAPQLVIADDGTPQVWIIDGSARRHVQDPASMAAWHFDWSAIVKTPAAQVYAHSLGLDWPEKPFLAQGSGPAVYMIDLAPVAPGADAGARDAGDLEGGSTNPPGDDAAAGSESGADASAWNQDSGGGGGCNASSSSGSGGVGSSTMLLCALALGIRSRTRARDRR